MSEELILQKTRDQLVDFAISTNLRLALKESKKKTTLYKYQDFAREVK